jgi:cysteinyl-tRNA synthetase
MDIHLYNTLHKKVETFSPLKPGQVSMYSCGPTVYNFLHIGNLRAYVFADILKRTFEYNGYEVKHIMNVTDIGHLTSDADEGEDKMVSALKRKNLPPTLESLKTVANEYTEKFKDDFEKINIVPPETYTLASEHIPSQIALIETLDQKGFVYKTSDGLYFDTAKFPEYGRLGISVSAYHSRIGLNNEKKDPKDFSLWKFADEGGIGFEAPFGKGFPGWHLEAKVFLAGISNVQL